MSSPAIIDQRNADASQTFTAAGANAAAIDNFFRSEIKK